MRPPLVPMQIGRLRITPLLALGLAVALLAAGLALALYNEHLGRAERVRQATTQAEILAASMAAPLAFDDATAAREYANALRANPEVRAAGAYGADGRLVAGYARAGSLPQVNRVAAPAMEDDDLVVTAPVTQGAARLGSVYLRVAMETLPRRATRYIGVALLLVMASLLIGVLGAAYASLREANRQLEEEIAEREKAEAALRQAQKMEAMGQLTGGVAHDFNNLLMAASSGLELLDRTNDPARRERLKQGIRQAIDRGGRLTQQLLAFSRRSAVNTEVIDLPTHLAGLRELLDRSLREDIVVSIEAQPGLWPVEVDPSELEVAILNVALNSRDAMPQGGRIRVIARNVPAGSTEATRDIVRLSIADEGVGMDPEMVSRVFEPFFTTKEVGQGTGLGLSQVYGFARSSGGEVQVESTPGRGTTLSLLLPRSLKAPAAGAATPVATPRSTEADHQILLVEDDDSVAELVADMLAELGYRVTRAANADSALDLLQHGQAADLILSDMVMPGAMNGLDLAHEAARSRPGVPVVLTTGYSAAAASASAEGIRLLLKPYRIETLAEELRAALAESAAH